MLRSHQAACPVTVIDSTVSSPPSPPGVSGGTADTLSWNEMPLPNKLLSQRPRGAAASGSCCFRVPIHPGRVWLGDTKIDQWRNKQAGCSAITMELLCKFNLQLALKARSFLVPVVVHCQVGWFEFDCQSTVYLSTQSPPVFRNKQPKELWCFHRIPRFYKLFWVPWTVNHQYLGLVRRWFWSYYIQKYLLSPYPGSWQRGRKDRLHSPEFIYS